MKTMMATIFSAAVEYNHKNIIDLLEVNEQALFLDLGCDDGAFSLEIAQRIKAKNIYGVEVVPDRIKIAQEKGVKVKDFDLNGRFNFDNNFFDVVHANQVIEHLYNSDNFIDEIYRVLKPGGYAIISTENASSWCNIFASMLGWQIFSLTNFSQKKWAIGNPLALHNADSANHLNTWGHVRVYNYRGLKEYFEVCNFNVEQVKGAGYFPLPKEFGNCDKRHSHFITFKIRKI